MIHPSTRSPCCARLWAAALLCMVSLAWAQPSPSGRALTLPRDSAADRVLKAVYQGSFSWVRIERAEAQAAPGLHPVVVAPEVLRAALAPLRNARLKDETLFNDDELAEIVPPLVRALAQLQPDQDLSFAVAGRHGGWGPMVPRSVTTGRMFRTAEGLQLIVGMVQTPFESQFIATGYLIPFEPGRRAAPFDKNVAIAPAAGEARRADWVTLALVAAAAPQPAPQASPPPQAAPPAAAAPVAAPAGAAANPPRGAAWFEEQEARLRTLKRLRESGLITEEEFQQKRREVLDKL